VTPSVFDHPEETGSSVRHDGFGGHAVLVFVSADVTILVRVHRIMNAGQFIIAFANELLCELALRDEAVLIAVSGLEHFVLLCVNHVADLDIETTGAEARHGVRICRRGVSRLRTPRCRPRLGIAHRVRATDRQSIHQVLSSIDIHRDIPAMES